MKIQASLLVVALSISAPVLADPAATVKAANAVENREVSGEAASFKKGDRVFVWSQIDDADGMTVDHVWKRDGKEFRRAHFDIGSQRWRVHSRLSNAGAGSYVVDVVAGDQVLGSVSFSVE